MLVCAACSSRKHFTFLRLLLALNIINSYHTQDHSWCAASPCVEPHHSAATTLLGASVLALVEVVEVPAVHGSLCRHTLLLTQTTYRVSVRASTLAHCTTKSGLRVENLEHVLLDLVSRP
jgi:hypothetical protein